VKGGGEAFYVRYGIWSDFLRLIVQRGLAFHVRLALATLLFFLASVGAWAQQVVAVPALSGRVVDLTNTLTAEQKSSLVAQLEALERSKGSQLVVLLVPTTQPETVAEYSLRVVEAWKIGRGKVVDPAKKGSSIKVDDGVLLLVAKNDRKIRIEVGYGLEGAIPDALAKRIISDAISPKFREGNYFAGLQDGVNGLTKLIQGEALPAPPEIWQHGQGAPSGEEAGDALGWLVPVIFVLVFGFVLCSIIGRFFGSSLAGVAAWFVSGAFGAPAFLVAIVAVGVFFILLIFSGASQGLRQQGRRTYRSGPVFLPGGFGGGWGSGGSSGGGFGGGGGSFGGGGASGDW
jgi:uncharacterized protein